MREEKVEKASEHYTHMINSIESTGANYLEAHRVEVS